MSRARADNLESK